MKKTLPVLLFTLLTGNMCNAQNFHWAKQISGNHVERVLDMTTDPSGNVISVGTFISTVDFDPGAGTTTFSSNGGAYDGYIQKLDKNGNFLWAKNITNVLYDYEEIAEAVETDAAGNIYVAGRFSGTVDFNPGPGVFQLSSKGPFFYDAFILKLDPSGNFIWAVHRQPVSNFEEDAGNVDIALDNNNNIYSIYSFSGSGGIFRSMIIEKANSSGTKIWDYKVEGVNGFTADIKDRNIKVDTSGNVIAGGTFGGTFRFNPASSTNTSSYGGDNAFVLKLDNAGNYSWVRYMGGSGYSTGYDLATNTSGDIYIAGEFSGNIVFNQVPPYKPDTAGGNWLSMYVLKLTPAGNYTWVKHFPGTGSSGVYALAVDAADNVFAAGDFNNQLSFKTTAPSIIKNSAGGTDAIAMKLNGATGNVDWVKQIGGAGTELSRALAIDIAGNTYVGGIFGGTANFDWDVTAFSMTPTGTVTFDAFVAKYGSCAPINTSVTQSGIGTLTAGATGASYQWINCVGKTPVAGATAKTFNPTHSGSYAVVVTQNGCSDTSACYSAIGTGISEIRPGDIALAMPNPNNGVFTIKGIGGDINAVVHVTNIYGQQVAALQTRAGADIQININSPAGVYFVTVSTTAGKQTEKIIVR